MSVRLVPHPDRVICPKNVSEDRPEDSRDIIFAKPFFKNKKK